MRRRVQRTRPKLDGEVIELLHDEPELLAVADAVAATQHRRGTGTLVGAAAAGVAVLAAIVGALQLTGGSPSLTDRALAAVGTGPVLHAVLVRTEADDRVFELSTRRSKPSTVRVEAWVDSRERSLRLVTRRNAVIVPAFETAAEAAAVNARLVALDPTTTQFLRDYRAALQRGRARSDSRALDVRTGGARAVVHLAKDYRPATFEPEGKPGWRILRFRAGTDAATPATVDRAVAATGFVRATRPATLAEATRALGHAPLLARSVAEPPSLRSINVQQLVRRSKSGGRTTLGLAVVYSTHGGSVTVQEARTPEPAYAFVANRLTIGLNPIPSKPFVDVHSGRLAIGQFRDGGLFVTIRAKTASLVIEVARELAAEPAI